MALFILETPKFRFVIGRALVLGVVAVVSGGGIVLTAGWWGSLLIRLLH
jgi:hypothetical protein